MMMDTRQQLKEFMEAQDFINMVGVASLAGISYFNLYKWMGGEPSGYVEMHIENFLNGDARRLVEITGQLKTGRTDRYALHQERASILKKARIHTTANQRVPSLNDLTI